MDKQDQTGNSKGSEHPFDEIYFKTGPYEQVSFAKYSQYWWSNRFYAQLVRKHGPKQGRVLEIGCGLGHLLTWLTDRYQVTGSDINEWGLQQASQNVPEGEFFQLSAEKLDIFENGAFQIIIAKHVVEHLTNPNLAVQEIARVLSPGGLFVMATPNMDSPMRGWKKEGWIGYQDSTHISLKPPSEWLEILRQNGMLAKKVFSDGFWDAPYLSWLPVKLQKVFFGAPGGLQAILGWSIIPLRMGESLIVLAEKQ